MTDVAVDANVLVAWFDAADTLHANAKALLGQLQIAGDLPVFLDVCIGEAVSVACRRARQRKGKVLQRQGVIGDLASFDAGFDVVDGFRRRGLAT